MAPPVLQFPSPTSKIETVLTLIQGKYATQAARDYFDRQELAEEKRKPIEKIFDHAQFLLAEGRTTEAQVLIDTLSDEDYETYKKIRASGRRKTTIQSERKMMPTVQKIQKLILEGRKDEAQIIVDEMTEEEYRIYKLAKEKIK